MNISEAPDLYLHDFMHCTTATRLADEIITGISRCTGVPNKVSKYIYTYECLVTLNITDH